MRLKANASNKNGTCYTYAPNGNAFPNMFSLSSLGWINDILYIFLWQVKTISDIMDIVLDAYELLTILIKSIIRNSGDGNNSVDGVISDVHNNSKTYVSLLLHINIIIQTLYDVLKLNSKNVYHKSNDTLLISLIIFQIENIIHIQINIDYTINVIGRINDVIVTFCVLIEIEMINSTYYLLEFKMEHIIFVLPDNMTHKDLNYILNALVQFVFDNNNTVHLLISNLYVLQKGNWIIKIMKITSILMMLDIILDCIIIISQDNLRILSISKTDKLTKQFQTEIILG